MTHITWKEFKDIIEQLGVRDNDLLEWIDVANFDPQCISVTQMTDTNAETNVYTITSSETVENP